MLYNKCIQLGESLRNKGEFDQAIEAYRVALSIARSIKKRENQVQTLLSLGLLYWNIGKLKKSYDFYHEALDIAKEIDLNKKKEEILNYIKIIRIYKESKEYRIQGQLQKAIESFKKAIDLSREINSKEHELKCLRQLSISYWELKDFSRFYNLNKSALEIAHMLNHRGEVGRCLNNKGIFYYRINSFSQALKHYEEALRISREVKSMEDESVCLTNIAEIYLDLGNYEKSLEYSIEALNIDQIIKNESIAIDLNNIGITFQRRGELLNKKKDFYKALKFYNECLNVAKEKGDKRTEIQVLNNIGFIHTGLENYNKALEFLVLGLKKAEEICDFESKSMIFNNIGIIHFRKGNIQKSIWNYSKAIALALEIKARYVLWESYFGLGKCYEKQRIFSMALAYYKKAVDIIDKIRNNIFLDINKAGFVRDKLKVYESLLNLLYELHRNQPEAGFDQEIYYQAENAKSRAFLESLEMARIDIRERLNPEMKKREEEISVKITSLIQNLRKPNLSKEKKNDLLKKLENKEDEYLVLMLRLITEVPQLGNLISQKPVSLEQIQNQNLDEKTAIVEFFLGEEKSFLFIISKNRFDLHTLPSKQKIEKSVKAYLKILSSSRAGKFRGIQASRRLYKELLFPIEIGIPKKIENLVIIPDGTLYYLPFESLISESDFLINEYKISYAPSSSALMSLFKRKRRENFSKNLLAVGNPIYTQKIGLKRPYLKSNVDILRELYLDQGFDFSPLPYSEREVLEISNFFSKEKRDVYLGTEAKEEVIKNASLKDYQIIHFACHGFLDEKLPLRSALVLSLDDDPEEDGFLQVREIYTLRFNADLIVLSACQTGKGRLEKVEGILGLPRVFFYTGASSVLTALWKINDKSTSKFMTYFYRYLSQGEDIAQALRLAKLKFINSPYSHPFYWAAFLLNGDYRSTLSH